MSNEIDPSIQVGNVLRVKDPTSLSLVGLPANQTAFKVVRKDTTGAAPAKVAPAKRVQRSAANPILRLAFQDLGTEEINTLLKEFGMEDYTISADGDTVVATRADLQSIAIETTDSIRLQPGVTAFVEKPAAKIQRADAQKHLKMLAIEFDAQRFDEASATSWLQERNIDISVTPLENQDTLLVVKRAEAVNAEQEVRRMEITEGVVVVLTQDDIMDVPESVVAVISEAAYGNWGWGQLDFNARLADQVFCEAMDSALDILRSTLYSLIYYSDLPLDVRQHLITNALTQFNDYVSTSMSQLPRQVLVAVVRADTSRQESSTVTKKTEQDNTAVAVARTDAAAPATPAVVPAAVAAATAAIETRVPEAAADESITLTRADLDARVDAEIARRSAAAAPAVAAAVVAPAVVAAAATEEAPSSIEAVLTRLDAVTSSLTALTAAQEENKARLERMESATVVRSDAAGADESHQVVAAQVARKDVFVGMFRRAKEG